MIPNFIGDIFRGGKGNDGGHNQQQPRGKGKGSNGTSMNSNGSNQSKDLKRSTSFSVKNAKNNGPNLSVATKQRIKSFCDYIHLFCSFADNQFDFDEVDRMLKDPIFVEEEEVKSMQPLMNAFANILRLIQTEPQDWFDFVLRCKGENAEIMSMEDFASELSKLCGQVGYPAFPGGDVEKLFTFIKGNRPTDDFGAFELAAAFTKCRLPTPKVRAVNIIASQLRNLAAFLQETQVTLREICNIPPDDTSTYWVSLEDLNLIFATILLRKEAHEDNEANSIASCDSPSGKSSPSKMGGVDGAIVSEIKSAPLTAERENSSLSPGLGPSKALSTSAMDQRAPLTLKQKSSVIPSPSKGQSSTTSTSNNNGKGASKIDNSKGNEATPAQTRKRSFLANVTDSVLRTFGSTATGTPNGEAPQKRLSFFALKRNSMVVPGDATTAGDTEQTESPNSINKSTSSGGSHSSQRSSVRNSFFDAKQLRSQLAHFLRADEQEQIKHISSGVITIKHGADPSAAIQGGLFSLDGSSISNKNLSAKSAAAVKAANDAAKDAAAIVTATADTHTVPRRRYSSLMMSTDSHDDWGDDLLDDPDVLDQLWITKHKQHRHHRHRHLQTTPSSSNLLTVKTDDGTGAAGAVDGGTASNGDGNQSVASKLSLPHSAGGDEPAVTGPLSPIRPNVMSREQSAALIRQLSTSHANTANSSGGHSAVQQYQKIVQSFDHRVGTAQRMVQQQLVR